MTKNNKVIADALKSSGLKQIEFAERIGVSRSHLSAICLGQGKASDQLTELVTMKFATVIKTENDKEEEAMYRQKFEDAQQRIIQLLDEIAALKESVVKKAGPTRKSQNGG
jgi:transcriptional regulator with XRE-family HTH domain